MNIRGPSYETQGCDTYPWRRTGETAFPAYELPFQTRGSDRGEVPVGGYSDFERDQFGVEANLCVDPV